MGRSNGWGMTMTEKWTLTADQQMALDGISEWIVGTQKLCTLSGVAGTGKTYLTGEIVRDNPYVRFTPTAVTHKAVAVLRDVVREHGLADSCYTTAKAANMYVKNDDEEQYTSRRPGRNWILDQTDVLMVDEASMAGVRLFDALLEALEDYPHVKILFVGDPCQLQPVKDGRHKAFYRDHVPLRFELKEVVRQQADNPMVKQAIYMRKLIRGKRTHFKILEARHGKQGIHIVPREVFVPRMIADILGRKDSTVRGLTFTNDAAKRLSDLVRIKKYGEKAAMSGWQPGERVMMLQHTICEGKTMHSSQEAVIESIKPVQPHPEYRGYEVRPMVVLPDDGVPIRCYETKNMDVIEEQLRELAKQAFHARDVEGDHEKWKSTWKLYWHFKQSFAEVVSAYVSTIHRAQGSTFDAVYIDAEDIMDFHTNKARRMHRLFYVALTRPRTTAYVKEWQ